MPIRLSGTRASKEVSKGPRERPFDWSRKSRLTKRGMGPLERCGADAYEAERGGLHEP